MSVEFEREIIRKAMAYDLILIFNQNPEKTYTVEELVKLIDAYISGVQQ